MTLVQQISLLVIFGFGLALAILLYRQQHHLSLQQKALRRQRFLLKKDHIVQELLGLSARKLGQQAAKQPAQAKGGRPPHSVGNMPPQKGQASKEPKNKEGQQATQDVSPLEQAKRTPNPEAKENTSAQTQEETADQAGAGLFEVEQDNDMAAFSTLLKAGDSLTDRLTKYAQWIAANSERFYFENQAVELDGEEPRYVRILFDQAHLDRQNGHWFNLFRSYDHTLAYELLQDDDADVVVRFEIEALESIKAEGLTLVQAVLESENVRLNHLVVDSGVADFIEYVDHIASHAKALFENEE